MPSRSPRVLLVEDSAADAELALAAFRRAAPNVAIDVVDDGDQAMAYLQQRISSLPDLVLLDLNLPRMNGREVLETVRADPQLTHLPVVVLSTSSSQRDVRELYRLHVSAYIEKPVSLAQFTTIVGSISAFWFHAARLPQG